jgi:hypothetical protein
LPNFHGKGDRRQLAFAQSLAAFENLDGLQVADITGVGYEVAAASLESPRILRRLG